MANINLNVALGRQSQTSYKFKDAVFRTSPENSDIHGARDLNAIRQGIENLFTWVPGQRIIQPEFPGNLFRMRYEQINEVTTQNIINEINQMFERWEPRVSIEKLRVEEKPQENAYLIYIEYSVPTLSLKTESFETLLTIHGS